MKREEAIKFWKFRYENAKDYTDPHWEASERKGHRRYVDALKAAIEALSDGAVQEWIPCSERLPKTMGEYLITVLSNPSKNPITSAAFYSTSKKEFGTYRPSGEWEKWDVVAWKPLPEPYKEGDNEN